MNCTAIQRRLLASERPDQPPAELKGHLAGCPVCRAWQRHVLELERQIRLLPVPPSSARARLLRKVRQAPAKDCGLRIADCGFQARRSASGGSRREVVPVSNRHHSRERALWKLAWALASAAALALFAVGWWAWPHNHETVVIKSSLDPYRAKEARFNERLAAALAGAQSAREKMGKVADFIEELHGLASKEVGNTDQLALTVRYHGEFMRQNLLEYARALPADGQRPVVLREIALRLQGQESRAAQLATTVKGDAADSLREMAAATRKGHLNLLALARGEPG